MELSFILYNTFKRISMNLPKHLAARYVQVDPTVMGGDVKAAALIAKHSAGILKGKPSVKAVKKQAQGPTPGIVNWVDNDIAFKFPGKIHFKDAQFVNIGKALAARYSTAAKRRAEHEFEAKKKKPLTIKKVSKKVKKPEKAAAAAAAKAKALSKEKPVKAIKAAKVAKKAAKDAVKKAVVAKQVAKQAADTAVVAGKAAVVAAKAGGSKAAAKKAVVAAKVATKVAKGAAKTAVVAGKAAVKVAKIAKKTEVDAKKTLSEWGYSFGDYELGDYDGYEFFGYGDEPAAGPSARASSSSKTSKKTPKII
jgi:hypothetical protein